MNNIQEIETFEQWFEGIIVLFAEIITVAGTANFISTKSENTRRNSYHDGFSFPCADLNEIIRNDFLIISDSKQSEDRNNLSDMRSK